MGLGVPAVESKANQIARLMSRNGCRLQGKGDLIDNRKPRSAGLSMPCHVFYYLDSTEWNLLVRLLLDFGLLIHVGNAILPRLLRVCEKWV